MIRCRVHDNRIVKILDTITRDCASKLTRRELRTDTGKRVTIEQLEKVLDAPPRSLAEENRQHSDALAAINKCNAECWRGEK